MNTLLNFTAQKTTLLILSFSFLFLSFSTNVATIKENTTVIEKPTVIYPYVFFELINNLGKPFEDVSEHIDKYWEVTISKKKYIKLELKGEDGDLNYGQYYYPYIEIVLKKGICTEVYFHGNSFNVFEKKNDYTALALSKSRYFIPDLTSYSDAMKKQIKKYTYKTWDVIGKKQFKENNVYYYVPYSNLSKGCASNENVEIIVKRELGLYNVGRYYDTSVFLTVDGENKNLKKMKREFNFD
ncbi:hypothetical protein A9Q86_02000 [Flavobacteriales bacterium 33_180_T64]|nr:hypothetical protein A9Q86_02000 [Flavobacteriales bacterium 33_180_T64]